MYRIVACAPNLIRVLESSIAQEADLLGGIAMLAEIKAESTPTVPEVGHSVVWQELFERGFKHRSGHHGALCVHTPEVALNHSVDVRCGARRNVKARQMQQQGLQSLLAFPQSRDCLSSELDFCARLCNLVPQQVFRRFVRLFERSMILEQRSEFTVHSERVGCCENP